jgi:hypothetical protein
MVFRDDEGSVAIHAPGIQWPPSRVIQQGKPGAGQGSMKKLILIFLLIFCLPGGAYAQSLDEAARQAARQYNAKVLSAYTEQNGNRKVHVIKLITRDGVVKTVRIPVKE